MMITIIIIIITLILSRCLPRNFQFVCIFSETVIIKLIRVVKWEVYERKSQLVVETVKFFFAISNSFIQISVTE